MGEGERDCGGCASDSLIYQLLVVMVRVGTFHIPSCRMHNVLL